MKFKQVTMPCATLLDLGYMQMDAHVSHQHGIEWSTEEDVKEAPEDQETYEFVWNHPLEDWREPSFRRWTWNCSANGCEFGIDMACVH